MVTWHPSGELLASASYDDSIKLWATDGDEWSCVQTLGGECWRAMDTYEESEMAGSLANRIQKSKVRRIGILRICRISSSFVSK